MATIPERPEQGMAEMIFRAMERSEKKDYYLTRLGASGIGKECLRRIFYDWRAFTKKHTEGRMKILFSTGDIYEARVVEWLRMIGLSVWDKNPETGKQYDYSHPSGHFTVRIDGVVRGVLGAEKTPHLLEIKSHNQKQFDNLEKMGVKNSHPDHYIQCQMGMNGMGLERALYVAVNKNDENFHFERIHYDQSTVDMIEKKIQTLINSTLTPAGISVTATAPGCRFCPHKLVCVGKEAPQKNCRTCRNCNPGQDGSWDCSFFNKSLTYGEQLKGCDNYDPRSEGISPGAYLAAG